jgi:transcriptional regulator with XRE-family HTH domain
VPRSALEQTAKNLPPFANVAAFLDAQGQSREDIATATGISPTHISRYRQREDYQALVREWQSRSLGGVADKLAEAKRELLDSGIAALRTGRLALEATDGEGRENWEVRLHAFDKLVTEMRQVLSRADEQETKQAGALAGAHAAVTLVIRREGDGHPIIEQSVEA